MKFLHAFFMLIAGLCGGIILVGFVGSLPSPVSDVPVIPICIAIALVLRARATMFWLLLTIIAVTDLYRSAGFGIGIVSFVILVMIGYRVTSELFTHRSLIGCIVISAFVGLLWSLLITLCTTFARWFHGQPAGYTLSVVILSALFQSSITALVTGLVYTLLPRWWRERSPVVVSSRGL